MRILIMRLEITHSRARAFVPKGTESCAYTRGESIVKPPEKQKPRSDEWTLCLLRVRDFQDQAAFVQLFRHFAPRVKSYLMKAGGSDTLAEEATQEALATVWQKASLFNPAQASASTWIFTIARNKNIDAIRKQKRPEPEELDWIGDQEDDASVAFETSQEENGLRLAVSKLPETQRSLIERAFYGEMSHSEIAAQTQIPLGTIKSRIRLALERIRHDLARSQ